MCSHTCLRGQACHPLTQTRWEIGLGAFLSQAFSIIGRGWWIGEMGCSITAYLRSPAAWYMWGVLSHWCLGPPHPQRLWTQRSQTFQPPLLTLPILHPHQDSFSSQNNLDPTGLTFQKFPLSLPISHSLFSSVALTCQSQQMEHPLFLISPDYWVLGKYHEATDSAGLLLLLHNYSIVITSQQVHSFYQSASHHKIESYTLFKHQGTPLYTSKEDIAPSPKKLTGDKWHAHSPRGPLTHTLTFNRYCLLLHSTTVGHLTKAALISVTQNV